MECAGNSVMRDTVLCGIRRSKGVPDDFLHPGRLVRERIGTRRLAYAESVVVTLLLGSTLVVAKGALGALGPLTLAALRYCAAFLLLLPFLVRRRARADWSRRLWVRFIAIGVTFYVVGNGALFLGLNYLPATTASLLLSLVPLLVLVAGVIWLRERPTRVQIIGVLVGLAGSALFFGHGLGAGKPLGIIIVAVGLIGNAAFGVLGRDAAKTTRVDTVALTAIPLAVGSAILLPLALAVEGWPHLSARAIITVLWLAAINTAGVFFLYNHALRVLPALQVSAIINCTPLVTALLARFFLGERLSAVQIIAMVIVIGGVALVQRRDEMAEESAGAARRLTEHSSPG
jgi:drug/metabolite transporter (DMT)-like permease